MPRISYAVFRMRDVWRARLIVWSLDELAQVPRASAHKGHTELSLGIHYKHTHTHSHAGTACKAVQVHECVCGGGGGECAEIRIDDGGFIVGRIEKSVDWGAVLVLLRIMCMIWIQVCTKLPL